MKRILVFFLAIALLMGLVGCGQPSQIQETSVETTEAPAVETTEAPAEETTAPAEEQTTAPAEETEAPQQPQSQPAQGEFSFEYQGVTLVPGEAFDAAVLPEAESVYQVPSCAIEGTDNVYSYGEIEVTAFNDGSGEVIYSVYILDANTPTAEGLYLGDMMEHVIAAYGENYTQENSQITYQRGDTLLVIIFDGDYVASIDFRWAV